MPGLGLTASSAMFSDSAGYCVKYPPYSHSPESIAASDIPPLFVISFSTTSSTSSSTTSTKTTTTDTTTTTTTTTATTLTTTTKTTTTKTSTTSTTETTLTTTTGTTTTPTSTTSTTKASTTTSSTTTQESISQPPPKARDNQYLSTLNEVPPISAEWPMFSPNRPMIHHSKMLKQFRKGEIELVRIATEFQKKVSSLAENNNIHISHARLHAIKNMAAKLH
ncbi:hypothetical protein BC830DRAFT_875481 [Chytriomyces sp. MP71]|nr:hypothetical protein BC830DRAFT_875481 [Chytriomyces sp. MP71]